METGTPFLFPLYSLVHLKGTTTTTEKAHKKLAAQETPKEREMSNRYAEEPHTQPATRISLEESRWNMPVRAPCYLVLFESVFQDCEMRHAYKMWIVDGKTVRQIAAELGKSLR
ncbi:MAG: hypothetical protein Q7T55_06600, partial [Solirubrobacteraceae bacterium]|nr:hypothetical protein [Solirubrobacteraceae bacterium]